MKQSSGIHVLEDDFTLICRKQEHVLDSYINKTSIQESPISSSPKNNPISQPPPADPHTSHVPSPLKLDHTSPPEIKIDNV